PADRADARRLPGAGGHSQEPRAGAAADADDLRRRRGEERRAGGAEVGHRQTVLMPVDYPAPAATAKNRVLVLLLTPTISVGDEAKSAAPAAPKSGTGRPC